MVAAVNASGKLVLLGLSGSRGRGQLNPTIPVAGMFPRFGVVGNIGGQLPTTAQYNGLSQYPLIILGHQYYGMPGGYTRQGIVTGLKGQTQTGKNAVVPIVYQYEMLDEIDPAGFLAPEWSTVCSSAYANWICYQLNASGTPAVSIQSNSYYVTNWALTGTYSGSIYGIPSGLTLPQWAAHYIYNKYILGTYESDMAAPALDGIWLDNMAVRCLVSGSADWLRNGTNQGQTNAAAIAACTAGKAAVATAYASLDSTRGIGGNTEYSADVTGSGLNGANLNGAFAFSTQEYGIVGNPSGSGFVYNRAAGGFASALAFYQAQQQSASNGASFCLGNYSLSDYATLRSDACFISVFGNGYFGGGCSSGINYDVVDPSNPTNASLSSWPVCDEFWGGSLELGGYLGDAANTAQGAVQTGSWSNGVARRDFTAPTVSGASVFYNTTTVPQTFTPGGTLYHIRSAYGSQAINSGALVSGTVTLPAGDGCVLIGASPP